MRRAGSLLLLAFVVAQTSTMWAASTDATAYSGPAWSPYVVGIGIGVLSWLTFLLSDKAIGASSFYATLAGMVGKILAPRHTLSLKYFQDNPPKLDWGMTFVLSAILGGAIAALSGGEFTNEWVHPMWEARFGDSIALRAVFAVAGGLLMGFGARLAGGCTSGHGISGTLQLSLSSWIVLIALFIGGIITAHLMFKL